jgi:hypothetical protein
MCWATNQPVDCSENVCWVGNVSATQGNLEKNTQNRVAKDSDPWQLLQILKRIACAREWPVMWATYWLGLRV